MNIKQFKKIITSKYGISIVLVSIIIILAFFALQIWFIMLLWNVFMPVLGVSTLTFWQAGAFDLLIMLLFGFLKKYN